MSGYNCQNFGVAIIAVIQSNAAVALDYTAIFSSAPLNYRITTSVEGR